MCIRDRDTGRWSHCFRMQVFAMAPICGILDIKVLMIMFGSTASNGNYLSEKGRFSFGLSLIHILANKYKDNQELSDAARLICEHAMQQASV